MMTQPPPALNVFLHPINGEFNAVNDLRSRLANDGINVILPDNKQASPSNAGDGPDRNQLRDSEIRAAIQESHVVLFCLSKESTQAEERLKEISHVLDMAIEKPQGKFFVVPVRFEGCDTPDSLKRWQAVDLFEESGYERLMQALKLHADQVGAVLEPQEEWRVPFRWEQKKSAISQQETKTSKVSFLTISAAVIVIAVLMLLVLPGVFKSASETAIPVDVMVENSTQSALDRAINRSLTQTAVSRSLSEPRTQTAVAEYALKNPTPGTVPFATIVALPTEIIDSGNVKMIFVPGDAFIIGNNDTNSDARPAHKIYLDSYYIDKFEVTNALYRICVDIGECEPPGVTGSQTRSLYYGSIEFDGYPVINVDWRMAKQYCEWRGARLPTEAEWEKAARGIDGRIYPWGGDADCTSANYTDAGGVCIGDTSAIGSYGNGQSLYGAFDMAGNVSEWVSSLYWSYPYNPADGREDPDANGLRVVRGGNWASSLEEITTYYRFGADPSGHYMDTGFRCARDAKL